jgi:type IV pilus assembly protein PilY1
MNIHETDHADAHCRSGALRRFAAQAVALLLCWGQINPALAVMAQVPLLTRTPSTTKPNVVFTFDDSGSMAWRFMPDAIWPQQNAIRWSTAFHPSDNLTFNNGGDSDGVHLIPTRPNTRTTSPFAVCTTDTQFSDCRASDLISARMRSPAYNTAFYNPEIRYEPWYNADGTQFPNSSASAAWLDPNNRTSGGTVNLSGLQPVPSATFVCRSAQTNTANTTASGDRNRTTATCGTLQGESLAFQTACEATSGTWTGSVCRFTSAQGASSGNCQGTYGGAWSSSRCDVTSSNYTNSTRGAAFCNNQVSGASWSNSACRKPEDFYPATYYEYLGGSFDTAANYRRVRIMDYTSFSRGAGRTDCSGSGSARTCTQAQEYVNFANWFTYYRTRNFLAIGASSKAFAEQGEDLRIGYGRINKGSSGNVDGVANSTLQAGVRVFSGTDKTNFFTWLHDVPAAGSTPLRRAMEDIGKYYMRADNNGPWSGTPGQNDTSPHLACRKSYHILMTDGYWNLTAAQGTIPGSSSSINTTNVDNTNGPTITGPNGQSYQYKPAAPYKDNYTGTLADVSMAFWSRDLRTDLANRVPPDAQNPAFWQHMVNFTVGLGLDGTLDFPGDLPALSAGTKNWPQPGDDKVENLDDLWHAALNSRGDFLSAKNAADFSNALSSFLNEITIRNASEGGVAATAATLQAGNRKYVPEYKTGVWSGNLTAYGLDEFGQQLNTVWDAASKLPSWDVRNIFVGTRNGSPKALPFTSTGMDASLQSEISGASASLINYLRGDTSGEGTVYRSRAGRLGDFVNSQPVYIKSLVNQQYNTLPTGTAGQDTYKNFVSSKASRTGVILIGGNDGMLHAFRDTDGVEVFAFIPRAVLPNLHLLASPSYEHRYYVDGQLTEVDAYLGSWRNIVLGSTGAGARAIFALDVTDTSNLGANTVLWELDSSLQSDIGHVMAPIEAGLMKNGQWAAVFGNGPYSGSGTANLFIVNLSTGALIRKIQASATGNNGLGGPRLIRDGNQVVVGAYAGDRLGNVWKFDLSSTSSGAWGVSFGGTPLYRAGSAKPITAAPNYVSHPLGGQMVVVGSGKLYDEGDQSDNTQQALLGLWDKQELIANETTGAAEWSTISATDAEVQSSQMVTHSISGSVSGAEGATYYTLNTPPLNWNIHRGWTLPLTLVSGQRNLLSPTLIFGYVLFETMSPTVTGVADPCEDSGAGGSYNLLLDPVNGYAPKKALFDVNGDGYVNDSDAKVAGYKGTWDGRDVVLSQKPCLTAEDCPPDPTNRCESGTKLVSVQSAVGGNNNICLNLPPRQRWWWRQIQQIPE